MRVLHLEKKTNWSGQANRTFNTCVGLSRRGCEVSLLCQPGGIIADAAASAGLPVIRVPMSGWRLYGSIPFVVRLLRKEGFHIVHAHGPRDHILGSAAATAVGKVRMVRTKHNLTPIKGKLAGRLLYRNLTDGLIAVSRAGKETLVRNGVPANKVHVVHDAVDLERFSPKAKDQELLGEFGLRSGEFVIGVAGRLGSKSKGTLSLLRAAKVVCEKCSNVRFVLAGHGAEKARAEAAALGLADRVILPGFRRDMPRNILHNGPVHPAKRAGGLGNIDSRSHGDG